jgi:hypothetical protein
MPRLRRAGAAQLGDARRRRRGTFLELRRDIVSAPRSEVLRLAIGIAVGALPLIEGCRRLVPHLKEAGMGDDPDALTIASVDFHAGRLPSPRAGDARSHDRFADGVRYEVVDACRSLIEKLTP